MQSIIPIVEQLNIDLPEIQEIDPHAIILAKLKEAESKVQGNFIVEDVSFNMEALNGSLPGPLIKWFLKAVGIEGLFQIAKSLGNYKASAKCVIGYSENGTVEFFEAVVPGTIVAPRGSREFGWDPIFQPDGFDATYAELTSSQKNEVSHRAVAAKKLKQYLKI